MFSCDEDHLAAVRSAFEYYPTPQDLIRAEAQADQREAAVLESDHYNFMYLPSGERHPEFNALRELKELRVSALRRQKNGDPDALDYPRKYREFWAPNSDDDLPLFDEDNPSHQCGLFVHFYRTNFTYVMRGGTVEALVENRHPISIFEPCSLKDQEGLACDMRGDEYLMLSEPGSNYLHAIPLCSRCKEYLVAEGAEALLTAVP